MRPNDVILENGFKYIDSKEGDEVLLLLHGLFGATGNFKWLQDHFKKSHRVITPILPIMDIPLKQLGMEGLVNHIVSFVDYMRLNKFHVVGNSLGGHLAQLYTLEFPEKIRSLTLTGSSGLFENAMGSTFPKRGDYEFVKKKAEATFYDPAVATKEIVDEVYDTVNDRNRAIRVIVTAKSAIRNNLKDRISSIIAPVLLVWGKEDKITPSWVGEKFHELLPNSELALIEKCGHAPMMEHPHKFNEILESFLSKQS